MMSTSAVTNASRTCWCATRSVEQLGLALLRLDEAMDRLKDHFELRDEDLNLDLGPLLPER